MTLRFIKSTRRPGVATIMDVPFLMSVICFLMSVPPYTAVMLQSRYLANTFKSFAICKQSSRVGQMIKPCGSLAFVSMLLINGKPNAAVFPVPVCARPTKSQSSCIRYGIAFSWMGVGASKPNSVNDFSTSLLNPSSSNVILLF